jgi:hypothetical protein
VKHVFDLALQCNCAQLRRVLLRQTLHTSVVVH